MDAKQFLFEDKLEEVKRGFINKGWITIYSNSHDDENDEALIYCCLVHESHFDDYKKHTDWEIIIGSEGRPSVYHDGTYKSFDSDGIEPFIYPKHFSFDGGYDSYIDISEEFILYFKLYEKIIDKQNRRYFYIDELGELDEVITVQPNEVTIKQKYLMEYISVRKMHLSICFDFMRCSEEPFHEPLDKNFESDRYFYNHFIRPLEAKRYQSWIRGKAFLLYNKNRKKGYHFDFETYEYERFITGYDEDGNELLESCKKSTENYFKLTYFSKAVLNKYYNEPEKYKIDGFRVSSNFFSLKIDNNLPDCVPVFLVELGSLPHREQLHWKQYNIPPKEKISQTYYRTMIEGSWVEHPETVDLFFKQKYKSFNESWKAKFGWHFYKPLSPQNQHYFDGLHIPTSNNVKEFCQQILALVILTIDSLNEREIGRGLMLEPNDKGIKKLDKFLSSRAFEIPEMIDFLKHLQNLRSGLVAHRFSDSNTGTKRAIEYFGISEKNYSGVAEDIFVKSVHTLNTLENIFDL